MFAVARPFLIPVAFVFLGAATLVAQSAVSPVLPPGTEAGWKSYVAATEQRIDREMKDPKRFLVLDFAASAPADRAAVLQGQMPVAEMATVSPGGGPIDVPDGWVHHFRGAVLIRGVRLDHVFKRLQEEVPGTGKGDIVASSIFARNAPNMRVSITVQRRGSVMGIPFNFVYKTEHDVTFKQRGATRGSSTSVATKIAELDNPGTPRESDIGEGHRYLLRWNSYWRYEEVDTGVIAECESLSLSRDAFGSSTLRAIADPTVVRMAQESMQRALINLRDHFATKGRTPPALSPAR